jgi:hypothetical protein
MELIYNGFVFAFIIIIPYLRHSSVSFPVIEYAFCVLQITV